MKTKALDKVLKNHLPHCKMHEFSLQKDRHCSCGVEEARRELKDILDYAQDLLTESIRRELAEDLQ